MFKSGGKGLGEGEFKEAGGKKCERHKCHPNNNLCIKIGQKESVQNYEERLQGRRGGLKEEGRILKNANVVNFIPKLFM